MADLLDQQLTVFSMVKLVRERSCGMAVVLKGGISVALEL